ncbi:MAG: hypothetical protein K0Q49_1363 [Haloplasmataceae bacterium]|nr:hypothetical protein [Haloplasmataceae bacterium]
MRENRRRFRDRYDGRLIRKADPFFSVIPHIMKDRSDAQVFFEEKIHINETERFIQQKRDELNLQIGFLHIVIAAMVRVISQKPKVNRFVAGRRIYARNGIYVSFAIKKELSEDSPETTVKVKFEPTDTIYDVIEKINNVVNENKEIEVSNGTDKLAKLISLCPRFIIKGIVNFIKCLDYHGKMPKIISKLSPFHTSFFVTDVGSLGIQPVYHHLYNFGSTSFFISFGKKNKEKAIDNQNNIFERKYVDMRIVVDERICDGYNYAKALRIFKRFMENPTLLETAPEKVIIDNEI